MGEGKEARSYRVSWMRLVLFLVSAVGTIVALTLVVLMVTPVTMYLPIPNPELERRYGHQIQETQERLNALAQDILMLRDYNRQLRKALGDEGIRDSTYAGVQPASAVAVHSQEQVSSDSVPVYDAGAEGYFPDYDQPGASPQDSYAVVVTRAEASKSRLPLIVPAEGYVTQRFDPANNHFGIDIAAKRGTPVFAAADGSVLFAGWTYDDGNMLIIAHGGGYVTVYKHNQTLLRTSQTRVGRGEPVALLGTSGRTSLGPHLHFEVWKDGIPQDPDQYLLTPVKRQ
jgi:murein DD-endopeptidase MepM/ murein hydrolase activator NlpD